MPLNSALYSYQHMLLLHYSLHQYFTVFCVQQYTFYSSYLVLFTFYNLHHTHRCYRIRYCIRTIYTLVISYFTQRPKYTSLYVSSPHFINFVSYFKSFLFTLHCINLGAIEFGIVFVPALEEDQQQNDLEVETVEDMGRIRSDLQTIVGSFSPPSEGVVFFLWDNTYVL